MDMSRTQARGLTGVYSLHSYDWTAVELHKSTWRRMKGVDD